MEFVSSGTRYSWKKVTTTVHNVIVGKLWLDHSGEIIISSHGNNVNISCHLKFTPYSYFYPHQQRKVKGYVLDAENNFRWTIEGFWDSKVDIGPVLNTSSNLDGIIIFTYFSVVTYLDKS